MNVCENYRICFVLYDQLIYPPHSSRNNTAPFLSCDIIISELDNDYFASPRFLLDSGQLCLAFLSLIILLMPLSGCYDTPGNSLKVKTQVISSAKSSCAFRWQMKINCSVPDTLNHEPAKGTKVLFIGGVGLV